MFAGRDVVFLNRMKDHATTVFAGALILNCFPSFSHSLMGLVFSRIVGFLANRAMVRSLPLVEGRLAQTSQWKAEPHCGWEPPVLFLVSV